MKIEIYYAQFNQTVEHRAHGGLVQIEAGGAGALVTSRAAAEAIAHDSEA